MSFIISASTSKSSVAQVLPGFNPACPPLSEMYSMNWIMFLPNVIIDAKLGCFWFMELNLSTSSGDLKPFHEIQHDYIKLVEFLLNRKYTKAHLLNACENLIRTKSSLKLIEKVFEKINEFYKFSLLFSSKLNESGNDGADANAFKGLGITENLLNILGNYFSFLMVYLFKNFVKIALNFRKKQK